MDDAAYRAGRILIVDDQASNIHVLERILHRAGYAHLRSTTDPRCAAALFDDVQPDLVVLDLHMPEMDGFAVLDELRPHIAGGSYLPILVVTGDGSIASRRRALSAGAKDFLAKPFDTTEVLLRIRNLLEARFLYLELQAQNNSLEAKVRQRTKELEEAQVEILERLALAAEFRDDATRQHTQRVGRWAEQLAQKLHLPDAVATLLRRAAPLHDLGKIGVPDSILLKLGRLTADEFRVIQSHTQVGARILSGSDHPLLQLAEQIALTHHEHWDGTGYTPGLGGEAIPLVSRIVAVVDVFDALTHPRPYKAAWSVEDAVAELERQSGRQFDPRVVSAFVDLLIESGVYKPALAHEPRQ
jgi:putative two-component system response regulator